MRKQATAEVLHQLLPLPEQGQGQGPVFRVAAGGGVGQHAEQHVKRLDHAADGGLGPGGGGGLIGGVDELRQGLVQGDGGGHGLLQPHRPEHDGVVGRAIQHGGKVTPHRFAHRHAGAQQQAGTGRCAVAVGAEMLEHERQSLMQPQPLALGEVEGEGRIVQGLVHEEGRLAELVLMRRRGDAGEQGRQGLMQQGAGQRA